MALKNNNMLSLEKLKIVNGSFNLEQRNKAKK